MSGTIREMDRGRDQLTVRGCRVGNLSLVEIPKQMSNPGILESRDLRRGWIHGCIINILKLVWDFQGSLNVGFVVNPANWYFTDPGSILSNITFTQFQLIKFGNNKCENSTSGEKGRSWTQRTGLEIKSMGFSTHKMFMNSNTGLFTPPPPISPDKTRPGYKI